MEEEDINKSEEINDVEEKVQEEEQIDQPEPIERIKPVEDKPTPKAKAKPKGHRPPKGDKPMVLNEKVKCPECNKTMTKHCLEYTHKCRAKVNSQLVIEDVKPTEPIIPKSNNNEAKHDLREVNVEDIVHN